MDRRAACSIIWGLLRLHFPRYAGVYSNQHQPFEVPVLFLLINILLAVLIGGYAAGELHGTGLNKLVRCRRRSDWWICKCIWNVISVLGYYAALIAGAVTAAFIASVKPGGAAFFQG